MKKYLVIGSLTFLVYSAQLLQTQAQTTESPMTEQKPPAGQTTPATPAERDSTAERGFDWGLLGLIGLLGLAGLTGRREVITPRRSPNA